LVVGVAVMTLGTGFIALLTAAAAQRFLAADRREDIEEGVENVEFSEAQILGELRQIREQLDRLHAASSVARVMRIGLRHSASSAPRSAATRLRASGAAANTGRSTRRWVAARVGVLVDAR